MDKGSIRLVVALLFALILAVPIGIASQRDRIGRLFLPSVASNAFLESAYAQETVPEDTTAAKQINVVPVATLFDKSNSYGIAIGINQYAAGVQPLNFAAQDAQSFMNVLTLPEFAGYNYNNFYLFNDFATDPNLLPTRNNILGKLLALKGNIAAGDTFYFFFSGHGLAANGENFLICSDTLISAPGDTAISFTRLYDLIAQIDCRKKVIVLDACRSEIEVGKGDNTQVLVDASYANAEGMVTFFSTAPGEKSYEDAESGHGVFTKCLLEALRGKGDLNGDSVVSVSEVADYVYRSTVVWANANNKLQKPWKDDRSSGDIPILALEGKQEVGYTLYESTISWYKSNAQKEEEEKDKLDSAVYQYLGQDTKTEFIGFISWDVKPETSLIYIDTIPAVFPCKGKIAVRSGSFRVALCAEDCEDEIKSIVVPAGVTIDITDELKPAEEIGSWIFEPDGFRLKRNVPDGNVLIDIAVARDMALGVCNISGGTAKIALSGACQYEGTFEKDSRILLAVSTAGSNIIRVTSTATPIEFWPYESMQTADQCRAYAEPYLIQPATGAFTVSGSTGSYYNLRLSSPTQLEWVGLDTDNRSAAKIAKREYYVGSPCFSTFDKGSYRGNDQVYVRICVDGKEPLPGGESWVNGTYTFNPPLILPEGVHRLFVTTEYQVLEEQQSALGALTLGILDPGSTQQYQTYYNTWDWEQTTFLLDCVYSLTYNSSESTLWLNYAIRPMLSEQQLQAPA